MTGVNLCFYGVKIKKEQGVCVVPDALTYVFVLFSN